MAIASDQQVQTFANERVRVRSELLRKAYLLCKDDIASIGDVYEAVTQTTPTWSDNRNDGPPHLLTPGDVVNWNAFVSLFIKFVEGTFSDVTEANSAAAQYAVIQAACVQGPLTTG